MMFPEILGFMNVIKSNFLTVHKQVRFPRSKRKRILKKFRKNENNWRDFPDPNFYRLDDGTIIGHPYMFYLLRRNPEFEKEKHQIVQITTQKNECQTTSNSDFKFKDITDFVNKQEIKIMNAAGIPPEMIEKQNETHKSSMLYSLGHSIF